MTREIERIDHDRFREWLTVAGEPNPDRDRLLRDHLAECGDCRAERAELARMDALLEDDHVQVRSGFAEEVMRRLPAAGWESRSPRSWSFPVAVMLLLGSAAALLLGFHSAESAPGLPLVGALGAMTDAVVTGLLAGAGMLWASWRGVGLALETVLSPSATMALIASVFCLDVLVLLLIARRSRAEASPAAAPGRGGAGGRGTGRGA